MDPSQISFKVMEENGNNYGALRLKRDTLERLRRLKLTVEYFKECGLSGTVRADNSVAVAFSEKQIDILEQRLSAELQAYI